MLVNEFRRNILLSEVLARIAVDPDFSGETESRSALQKNINSSRSKKSL